MEKPTLGSFPHKENEQQGISFAVHRIQGYLFLIHTAAKKTQKQEFRIKDEGYEQMPSTVEIHTLLIMSQNVLQLSGVEALG